MVIRVKIEIITLNVKKTMDKKAYITPLMNCKFIATCALLAASDPEVTVDTTSPSTDPNLFDVKGSSYNVWNDDWSE